MGGLKQGPSLRLAVALITLVTGGFVLGMFARGAGPLPGDLGVTRLVQAPSPEGVVGLLLLEAGSAAWALPVLALVVALLLRRWADALFVLLASIGAFLLGDALKLLVGRPRPSPELVTRYEVPEGYGFPSGTALLVVVVLGVCCFLILRSRAPRSVVLVATGVSAALVVVVGLSRVYAGEHWASDVLGGWLFGGALLVAMLAAHRGWTSARRRRRGTVPTGTQEAGHVPRRGAP